MKYDDASWHFGGEFPKGSPDEYGGTHIGLFLKWCFVKGWAGELHLGEEPEDTQRVIDGALTGTDFLFKYCDGKFTDEDLNEEGNAFAQRYYGEDGLYLDDYTGNFEDLMYVAPEDAHDYQRFHHMMQSRFDSGELTKREASASQKSGKKPWWKIW